MVFVLWELTYVTEHNGLKHYATTITWREMVRGEKGERGRGVGKNPYAYKTVLWKIMKIKR